MSKPWCFKVKQMAGSRDFVAWCAQTPDLGNSPLEVDLSLDVRFAFGATANEALSKVRAEVLN